MLENMQGKELQLPKDGIAVSGGVFTNAMLRTVSIQSNEGDNKAKMDAGSSVTSSSPSTSTSTTSNDITPVVMSAPNSLRSRDDHIATPEKVVTEVVKPTLQLVSLNKPVQADVRGNLGPISVVTNENVEDWLADRWQGTYS